MTRFPGATDSQGGWTPTRLGSSVQAWFDASRSSTITIGSGTTTVSQWSDISGNNYHATQTTDSRRPEWYDGNRVNFARVNGDFFNITTLSGLTTRCVAAVVNVTFQSGQYSTLFGSQFNAFEIAILPNGAVQSGETGDAAWAQSTGTLTFGQRAVVLANATLSASRFLAGGVVSNHTYTAGSRAASSPAYLGASEYSGAKYNYFLGDMHEVVICNNLSEANQQLLEAYLAHKWGVAATNLPSNHPYRNYAP